MSVLRLANNLTVPIGRAMSERGGQRIAIIGKSGSGKTNTQLITTKAFMENGWPVVIVDPMNGYRTLKQAGLPILIAGARSSADLNLTFQNAGYLAETVFKERMSVILELSMYEDGQDINILDAFLRPFWRQFLSLHEDAPKHPFGLVIDEAHLFAPQSGKTEVTQLINDMGKRGRQLGLSIIFSTQRPASIQKDFLLMSNMLIAHKVTFGDVGVVAEAVSQPPGRVSPIIKKFKTGEAIVMADADLVDSNGEDFIVSQIYKWEITTNAMQIAMQESSRMRPISPELISQLQETMKRPQRHSDADKDRVIQQLQGEIDTLRIELDCANNLVDELRSTISAMQNDIDDAVTIRGDGILVPTVIQRENGTAQVQYEPIPVRHAAAPRTPQPTAQGDGPVLLNSGSKRILQTLADIYPLMVTKAQLGTLADYKITGGAFTSNWSALKRYGLVVEDDLITVTPEGFNYLGIQPREIPTTKAEVLAMWRNVLKDRAWDILNYLIQIHPNAVTKEQLGLRIGMESKGGAFGAYLTTLKQNALIVGGKDGLVRANGEMLLL